MAKVEMGVIFKTDKRRIIPRWRSYNIAAAAAGEVLPVNNSIKTVNNTNIGLLKDQIDAWKKNKNLSQAGDLLSSAYVLGIEDDFHEVAKFILDKSTDTSSPLTKIAQRTLGIYS